MSLRSSVRPESPAREPRTRPYVLGFIALGVASALILTVLWNFPVPKEVVGALVISLVVVLLLMGVHIAVAITTSAVLGILILAGRQPSESLLERTPYTTVASWEFSVIPFFVLMGMALWRSGITDKTFDMARAWLGKVPGGLAVGTIAAGGGLAAASGSTVGVTYALGRVGLPEMLRSKYDPGLAVGAVSMAGILGQIIPPSVMLVVYAGVAQTSIGAQLLAGVVPGLILIIAFALMVMIRVMIRPHLAPAEKLRLTWSDRVKTLWAAAPLALVMSIVIGGIMFGFVTATEAGALGAVTALAIGAVAQARAGGVRQAAGFVRRAAVDSVYPSAAIFLLLIGVALLTYAVALSGVAQVLTQPLVSLGESVPVVMVLLVLIPVFLLLGCFIDTLSIIVLTVPIVLPAMITLGVDPVWFGVFVVILAELGLVTPPLGMLVFIVHRIARSSAGGAGVSLATAFRGNVWYVATSVIVLVLLVFVPGIVTWLPMRQ